MNVRSFAALAAALTATTALSACGGGSGTSDAVASDCKPAHTFTTVKKGSLTVASYDLPPFTKIEGKKLTGVDADILDAIAKKECLSVRLTPLAAAAAVPSVQSGRADLAAGDWYRTTARAEIVSLSDPLYLDQMALVTKDGSSDLASFKGKSVGVVDGYLWVDDVKKYLGGDVKTYASGLNMYQDLKAGRIDAATDSYGAAVATAKDYKIKVVDPDKNVAASEEAAQAAFPLTKDNAAMLKAFNEDLAELHEDGTIAEILTKHGLDASAAETGDPRLIG